jgi:hypothetical protein
VIDGGKTSLAIPVLYNAKPEITWSVFGRVTAVTPVLLKKVPLSSVKPDEDKSTDPVHELFVDEVAELTVTLPLTEQLWMVAAKVGLINLGLSSERIGVKSVPTKTATSKRATRGRRLSRRCCGTVLRLIDTWLLGVKIGGGTHSWRRMPQIDCLCTYRGPSQMS